MATPHPLRSPWPLLALLAVLAFAFARHRTPYDDEWFSLTLARDTSRAQFWASLANDVHPPLVAVLDRAAFSLGGAATATALHLLASFAALALLCRAGLSLGLRPTALALGALHPVVFFYAGALRWYAFALLADALRRWALASCLSHRDRLPVSAGLAFALGVALGPLAGHAQWLCVSVDAALWLALLRQRALSRTGLAWLVTGALMPVISLLAWAPGRAMLCSARGHFEPSLRGLATFFVLGLLGEAHLPPPWTPLALGAVPGLFVLGARARRTPGHALFAAGLGSAALGWALAVPLGVGHPRYALVLWWGTSVLLADALLEAAGSWRSDLWRRRAGSVLLCASAGWLLFALFLTVRQRDFLKGDLALLDARVCPALYAPRDALVVVPYPRLRELVERACAPSRAPVTMGLRRHFTSREAIAPVLRALPGERTVQLLELRVDSSLALAQGEARALLDARCRRGAEALLLDDPFARWKPGAAARRLRLTRYDCDPR